MSLEVSAPPAMKLYAVIYIKKTLAAAMFLWNGATIQDCQAINSQFSRDLDVRWWTHHLDLDPTLIDPDNPRLHLLRSDVRFACEWSPINPVKKGE
jgi:hypothetical protein